MPAPVVIVEYSAEWPSLFAAEARILAPLFTGCLIEHIGSTAVPGLAAKPIIDMMLGANSLRTIEARIPALVSLRYEYFPEHERALPHRRFFVRAEPPCRVHLHAVVSDTPFWLQHLAFRDALRSSSKLAREYAALKYQLAQQFRTDREGYTDAKASFIRRVL